MIWENLKYDLCPECGKKLHLRRGKAVYRRGDFENRLMTCQKTKDATGIACGFAITFDKYEKLKLSFGFDSLSLGAKEDRLMRESSSLLDFYVKKSKIEKGL